METSEDPDVSSLISAFETQNIVNFYADDGNPIFEVEESYEVQLSRKANQVFKQMAPSLFMLEKEEGDSSGAEDDVSSKKSAMSAFESGEKPDWDKVQDCLSYAKHEVDALITTIGMMIPEKCKIGPDNEAKFLHNSYIYNKDDDNELREAICKQFANKKKALQHGHSNFSENLKKLKSVTEENRVYFQVMRRLRDRWPLFDLESAKRKFFNLGFSLTLGSNIVQDKMDAKYRRVVLTPSSAPKYIKVSPHPIIAENKRLYMRIFVQERQSSALAEIKQEDDAMEQDDNPTTTTTGHHSGGGNAHQTTTLANANKTKEKSGGKSKKKPEKSSSEEKTKDRSQDDTYCTIDFFKVLQPTANSGGSSTAGGGAAVSSGVGGGNAGQKGTTGTNNAAPGGQGTNKTSNQSASTSNNKTPVNTSPTVSDVVFKDVSEGLTHYEENLHHLALFLKLRQESDNIEDIKKQQLFYNEPDYVIPYNIYSANQDIINIHFSSCDTQDIIISLRYANEKEVKVRPKPKLTASPIKTERGAKKTPVPLDPDLEEKFFFQNLNLLAQRINFDDGESLLENFTNLVAHHHFRKEVMRTVKSVLEGGSSVLKFHMAKYSTEVVLNPDSILDAMIKINSYSKWTKTHRCVFKINLRGFKIYATVFYLEETIPNFVPKIIDDPLSISGLELLLKTSLFENPSFDIC